jgi:hypothetical protein
MAMLYQTGVQKIEVIVRREGGGVGAGAGEENADDKQDKPTTWRTAVFGSESPTRIKRVIKTNMTHALAVSKQVLDLGIEYAIGGLGYRNGDQSYQERVSRQVEVIKDATNVASSVGMGFLYGSWGGPIGAALGATFGAVSTLTSINTKYANREREYNYKVFKENNAIEYQRSRANINLTMGRLR